MGLHPKQTSVPGFRARPVIRPHHARPYRGRHIAAMGLAGLFVALVCMQIGVMIGGRTITERMVASAAPDRTGVIRSSQGFELSYNPTVFVANGTVMPGDTQVFGAQLGEGRALHRVVVRPLSSAVAATVAGSRLDIETTATYAPYTLPAHVALRAMESSDESLGGVVAKRSVYELSTPTGKTYSVRWEAKLAEAYFSATLRGLTGPAIPAEHQQLLSGLQLGNDAQVKGAATQAVLPAYLSDTVSPSVVKVYHVVCGTLLVNKVQIGGEKLCDSVTGSGFFISSDGYIATSGHVVVGGAKEIFVNLLLTNPALLSTFLRGAGLSQSQIANIDQQPELLAGLIAQVYDAPDDLVRLENKRESVFVALGSDPLPMGVATSPEALLDTVETNTIRKAKLIDYDYAAKDLYTIVAEPDEGFSSSDVAVLKVAVKQAPALSLFRGAVRQSQPIMVVGFPSDAENGLTNNRILSPTVTSGSIGSIRTAAGTLSKLYQSDADASHGNSGGPAVDMNGQVIGLLTYRYASSQQGDAAKSYIRGVDDLVSLLERNDIILRTDSPAQAAWTNGLQYFDNRHYRDALTQFGLVRSGYPPHRLAGQYAGQARVAIAEGRNVARVPAAVYFVALGVGMSAVLVSAYFVFRHYGHHKMWKHGLFGSVALTATHGRA